MYRNPSSVSTGLALREFSVEMVCRGLQLVVFPPCSDSLLWLPRHWQQLVHVVMGKRYFCDYCDRSFQDNLHNRKKHLNGLQHLKAKKSWYDMFRGRCPPAQLPG